MLFMNIKPAEPRPRSVSSHMAGLSGVIMLVCCILIARNIGTIAAFFGIAGVPTRADGPYSALLSVCLCAVPMVGWSLFVDKVHRRPSTGLDWSLRRPLGETLDISVVKLAGFWCTWLILAFIYGMMRFYWEPPYTFAMEIFQFFVIPLVALSIPYVIWVDRHMVDPKKDAVYHFGAFIAGRGDFEVGQIKHHLRNWAVKGFFCAFMIAILPGGWNQAINADFSEIIGNPVAFAALMIGLLFLVDVQIATVGYLLTMKPLDSHIRSANPFVQGWVAALLCYPPFVIMNQNATIDYHYQTAEWAYWFADYPALLALWAALLIWLTGVYAWATVAFGLRFSNLTYRGVITHGPYAWTKHPAYLSKNAFWWCLTLPFLVTSGDPLDSLRNTAMIVLVSLIYYWRARTEEAHMRAEDPAYVEYEEWMRKYGPVPRFVNGLRRKLLGLRHGSGTREAAE